MHYSIQGFLSKFYFNKNLRNENQILVYLILLNSSVCSSPVVRNLLTGQETRLAPIGSKSEAADEPISTAIFDRRGNYIITGSTKANFYFSHNISYKKGKYFTKSSIC